MTTKQAKKRKGKDLKKTASKKPKTELAENDGKHVAKNQNKWVYDWKNHVDSFPLTVSDSAIANGNIPQIVSSRFRLDRKIGDDLGEMEYIAKQEYGMLWKTVLEPSGPNHRFANWQPEQLPAGEIATEHWDHTANQLTDDHREILRLHDDFAARTTVRIDMPPYQATPRKETTPKDNASKDPKLANNSLVAPGDYAGWTRHGFVTHDPSNPVIRVEDYAPRGSRMVLPMTRFRAGHPLLITDWRFNPGMDYGNDNIGTIDSWEKAVADVLNERGSYGYPRVFTDGTEDQTISGCNGRPATVNFQGLSRSWSFAADGQQCTLRGTGVPWGLFRVESGTTTGAGSCAVDTIIMLGRWLGVFYREGDKPVGMAWDQYLSGLTGPQRLFRKLVARDWDRTPKCTAMDAKKAFWEGAIRRDVTAGLPDEDVWRFWESYDDFDFETSRKEFSSERGSVSKYGDGGNNGVNPWDDLTYDPDKNARQLRIQSLKAHITQQKSIATNFAPHLDICEIWNYVFGQYGASHAANYHNDIFKQCWNFNFRVYNNKLYCRTCQGLFYRSKGNAIPTEQKAVDKADWERRPYETLRSFVAITHQTDDLSNYMQEAVSETFISNTATGNVCLNCNPGWTPELLYNPETKQKDAVYQHPNPDDAPCAVLELVGDMPKQLVVQISYNPGSSWGANRSIRNAFSQELLINTISASPEDPNQGVFQFHSYRFVGGVFCNTVGENSGTHFRTYMKETADTYRVYDGMLPVTNRGLTLGGIRDDRGSAGNFADEEFGNLPVLVIYERVDEGERAEEAKIQKELQEKEEKERALREREEKEKAQKEKQEEEMSEETRAAIKAMEDEIEQMTQRIELLKQKQKENKEKEKNTKNDTTNPSENDPDPDA